MSILPRSTSDSGTESEGDRGSDGAQLTESGLNISITASDPGGPSEAADAGSPFNPFGPTQADGLSKHTHRRSKSAITASSFMGQNPFDEPSTDTAPPPRRVSLLDFPDGTNEPAKSHRRTGSLDFDAMMNASIEEEPPKAHSRQADKSPFEKQAASKWGNVRASIVRFVVMQCTG